MLKCLLFVCQINFPGYDLLDSVKSDSPLLVELKDAYRAYRVNDIVDECKQNIYMTYLQGINLDRNEILENNLKACEHALTIPIRNEELRGQVHAYVNAAIRSFRLLKDKGDQAPEFKADMPVFGEIKVKYYEYLHERFDKLVTISEKKYWKAIDKKNFAKSKEYNKCMKTSPEELAESLKTLEDLIAKTDDFPEQTIYRLGVADLYVKFGEELIQSNIEAYPGAVGKYKYIFDQKKYCMYLYEAWAKWRCILQQTKGASHTSEIPNDFYNERRTETALIILDHIRNNENDEMAINQFLVVATHENIKRFGQYQYGNQNAIEFVNLFGKK